MIDTSARALIIISIIIDSVIRNFYICVLLDWRMTTHHTAIISISCYHYNITIDTNNVSPDG